jgi:hypothetical protein
MAKVAAIWLIQDSVLEISTLPIVSCPAVVRPCFYASMRLQQFQRVYIHNVLGKSEIAACR